MKLKSLGFAVLSTLTTISAVAADLTLVGDSAANWDTSTLCWTNSTGTSVAFQTGDNVLISSDYFTGPSLTMTARLIPGDVEFDIDRNLDFSYSALANGIGKDAKSFVKRGSGTLRFCETYNASGVNYGNVMTCGVDIVQGEIALTRRNNYNSLGPSGDSATPYWVRVRNGASLSFLEGNQTAPNNDKATSSAIKIRLDEGSKLNVVTNNPANAMCLFLNTLLLGGGDIVLGSKAGQKSTGYLGGANDSCSIKIFNELRFSGSVPHAFGYADGVYPGFKAYSLDGTLNSTKISLNAKGPVEICVDEIADGTDAYVNLNAFTWGTNDVINNTYKCDIVKTGAGTLCFPTLKSLKGDFSVREGVAVFAKGQGFFPSGGSYTQTITVSTNATLRLEYRNFVDGTLSNPANIKIVVDHGTLEFVPEGGLGLLQAKDWVFDDALLCVSNRGFSAYAGIFYFKRSVTFKGTRALEMWPSDIGGLDTSWQAVHVNNDNGARTTVQVDDMTGDGNTDVIMGYHIWNGLTAGSDEGIITDSGFVKTGIGTFSVASAANKVSGVVTVSNGAMRVDGVLTTPSSVEVASGAFLGGTGTVAKVSMESGSGFAAPAGQAEPLTVQGDLVLPATGVVDIANLDGVEEKDLRPVKLVAATGNFTGTENLGGWTVKVNGVTTRKWKLNMQDGILRAHYDKGIVIILR